jgi:AbrB family looped-hinge helix DNA binding protein
MTFLPSPPLIRVQEKGQVTLPTDVRKKLGLKKGDLVAVRQTKDGILITPQQVIAKQALAEIGKALKEKGLTLGDVIESSRAVRGDLLKERYGIEAKDER